MRDMGGRREGGDSADCAINRVCCCFRSLSLFLFSFLFVVVLLLVAFLSFSFLFLGVSLVLFSAPRAAAAAGVYPGALIGSLVCGNDRSIGSALQAETVTAAQAAPTWAFGFLGWAG